MAAKVELEIVGRGTGHVRQIEYRRPDGAIIWAAFVTANAATPDPPQMIVGRYELWVNGEPTVSPSPLRAVRRS